jgi:lipopolysaccharide cholinephosphotransferase
MREMSPPEIRDVQLGLLDAFSALCADHGLTFFLTYGTLLGAVRHKGYIPWDDDIDLAMPRPDYDRLCALSAGRPVAGHCVLMTPDNPHYIYPFAKFSDTRTHLDERWMLTNVLGVNLDVFPLDGVPGELASFAAFTRKMIAPHYLACLTSRKIKTRKTLLATIASALVYYPLRLTGFNRWKKKIISLATRLDYNSSDYVGNLSLDTYLSKERFPKKWFEAVENIPFEGRMLPAPIGRDALLRQLYGDYMQLPPPGRRIKTHVNTAFWIP